MNVKKLYLLIRILLIVALLPQGNVSADAGPKPSMDFEFVQNMPGDKLTIVSGVLYECEKPDCSDAQPVMEKGIRGPWGFACTPQNCTANTDGSYFQLEVTFSDGIARKSNIFGKSYFNAKYEVRIKAASLSVEELEGYDAWEDLGNLLKNILIVITGIIFGPLLIGIPIMLIRRYQGQSNLQLGSCLILLYMTLFSFGGLIQNYRAFLLTLFIEFGIALGYLVTRRIKMGRILFAIVAANAFTQPVFFFFVSEASNMIFATIVGELLVWFGEAVFVYMIQQKQQSFKHVLLLTFILNAASFGIGLLLPI